MARRERNDLIAPAEKKSACVDNSDFAHWLRANPEPSLLALVERAGRRRAVGYSKYR